MEEVWFKPLVWADHRLALIFTLILPLLLFLGSAITRLESIRRLLIIYWRVASLLMIAIYLMIPGWPLGFAVGFAARLLIPISLWFWVDLNDEIKDLPPSFLKLALTSWRWAVTIYCSLGAIASFPFLSCAFSPGAIKTSFCQVWLSGPWQYQSIFHSHATSGFLGFLGIVGLIFYILYFGYFLFFRLGKQGRSALEQ